MKRTIVAMLLCASSASALALSAQGYEMMREDCHFIGKISVTAFEDAKEGKPSGAPRDMETDPMYNMAVWATDFGSKAVDRESAWRRAVAKCVDNFERIHRDWRYNIKTDPSQFR